MASRRVSGETGCARVVVGLGVPVRVQVVKSRHSLVAVMLSYPFAFGDATFAFLGQSFEHFRSLIMPYIEIARCNCVKVFWRQRHVGTCFLLLNLLQNGCWVGAFPADRSIIDHN